MNGDSDGVFMRSSIHSTQEKYREYIVNINDDDHNQKGNAEPVRIKT